MKKIYTFVAVVLLAASIFAQAPQSFKYQAVLRDGSGNVKASTAVSINISILQGSASGTAVYSETHSATTNAYGLVNLDLGNGTPTTGTFANIDWSTGTYFVKVAIGGVDMGTSQLLSVPYALNAKTAESVAGLSTKVDKVTGKDLSTNDYTTAEQTKLAAISGTNTGDQDLSGLATTSSVTTSLNLKVDKVTGKDLSTNDYTTAEQTKLAAISGTNTGDQDLSGLATTSSVTTSLNLKVDKVTGKDLSTNDYTTTEKTKLAGVADGAEVNVQADWNQVTNTADDYIKNKPTIPTSQWTTAGNNITYASGAVAIAGQATAYDNTPFADYNGLVFQAYKIGGLTGTIGNIISTGANSGNWPSALAFSTRNSGGSLTEKVRISDVGNVGIGTIAPNYKLDVAGDVNVTGNFKVNGTNISASALTYASVNISNAIVVGAQNLSIMSANGLSITGGTTIALTANTIYEITAVVQIYNTAAEAYTFMFYNETDAYYFNGNPMYFGQSGNDRNYHNEVVDFIFNPSVNTSITFKKQSTNTIQGNLIGNIVIKVLR